MTSTLPDLAPTVASRVVSIDATTVTEDAPKAGHVDFTLPCDLHSVSGGKILAAGSTRVTLLNGRGEVRLPVYGDDATTPDQGDDWVILVKKSWSSHPYAIRVPAGSSAISLAELPAVRALTRREQVYAITGVALTVTEGTQAGGTAQYRNGLIDLNITVPPFRPQTVYPYINTTVRGEVDQRLEGVANAYELAMDRGFAGTMDEWLHSLIGPRGPEGPYGGTEVTDPQVASMLADTGTEVGQLARAMFPSASATTVDYWVSPDGSDYGDGTASAPFRTLARAISMIPDMVRSDHHCTIHLAAGDWGGEELLLEHRLIYGKLTITGSTGDRELHRVHRVHVNSVFGDVRFENITATLTGTGSAWRFERATPWMDVHNCGTVAADADIREDSGVIGLLSDQGSTVHARDCEFNGRRYGLRSNYGSRIFSRDNTGTGNVFGLGARWGGILSTHGTQPAGETALTTDSGGIIGHGFGGKVGVPRELCLVESQEATEGRVVRKRWLVRENSARIAGEAINEGQRLRLSFQKTVASNTLFAMDVQYQALVQNSTGDQFVRSLFNSIVSETEVRTPEATVLAHKFTLGIPPEDIIQWAHSGSNNVFYLDIVPRSAQIRWFGVNVEISNMREQDAPVLFDVSVI